MLDNTKPFPKVVAKGDLNPLYSLSGKYCPRVALTISEIIFKVTNSEKKAKDDKRINSKCIEAIVNEMGLPKDFSAWQFWFYLDQE